MQDNIERQLEELEALEAIYPEELTVDTDSVRAVKNILLDLGKDCGDATTATSTTNKLPIITFMVSFVPLLQPYTTNSQITTSMDTESSIYTRPSIVVQFPHQYPEISPPLVTLNKIESLWSTDILKPMVENCLKEIYSGEECTMQLIMSLNEQIETQNEQTLIENHKKHEQDVQTLKKIQEEKEQTRSIKLNQEVAAANQEKDNSVTAYTTTLPAILIGRRVINSPYILKPAKIKDIQKCADELQLGGYAKVGKPGIIVIEGPVDACQQYCPMLEDRGWKHQKVQGEEQQEGLAGQSIDELRRLPREFQVLGEDALSELSQLCRDARLADLFFGSLGLHNSVSVNNITGCNDNNGGTASKSKGRSSKHGGKR